MEHKDYRLAAVMFTDIVGFSRMMEEDEKGTLQTLDFHDKLVREQVERHRGSVIKTIGDAFLAQFSTTLDAVECALGVQEGIREYNDARLGKSLTLRIGVHLGDIYFYENDALGEGINIASRLQSLTKPGHITISREVYSQVSGKIPMRVESMGQVHLKNITREVHAYEIIPGGQDNNSSAYLKAQKTTAVAEPPPAPPPPRPAAPEPTVSEARPVPPSFRDFRDEWRSLKDHIKDQVSREIEGGPERWRHVRHELRHELRKEFGKGGRYGPMSELVSDFLGESKEDLKNPDGSPLSAFQLYKRKRQRQAKRARGGWVGHFIPFLAVNGFLFFLYLTLTPGVHPWFLYPLFGWGIGLVSHRASVKAAQRTVRELDFVDDLGEEDFELVKKYQDSRAGVWTHVSSNTAVSALLLMIWFITTPTGFLWPLIPIGGMAIGVFSHLGTFFSRRGEFRQRWKALTAGRGSPSKKAKTVEPVVDPLVAKARTIRDSIVAQASAMGDRNPFGEDMGLTLDNYVRQIGELSAIEKELAAVVTSFDTRDLEAQEASVRERISATGSDTLKREYEKSLLEMEKQKKSFADLAEQQEILNLRIKSAMGNLQQMQIDLARIKGLSDSRPGGTILSLKDRSEELSRYLEDYREGLKEVPS